MYNIGERIKQIRLDKGLTKEQLAATLELTNGYVSQLESGEAIPSVFFLYNLADILEVQIHEFFTSESPKETKWREVTDYFENHDIGPEEVINLFKVLRKLK
ncbi:helix-turn-helix domain-containing protein [Bacillus sp. V5-8f]|uniref:helix-turn-helix domain-containing protein n=1 Tax=Bacillus sp. V5-8f TaxID=2053044 RepID=UPI0015E0AFFC|nr:helix-turn-helix transcriptional regulator [Bacillus sp. V5-8f]